MLKEMEVISYSSLEDSRDDQKNFIQRSALDLNGRRCVRGFQVNYTSRFAYKIIVRFVHFSFVFKSRILARR